MDKFIIHGRAALSGSVTPSGNKNSALPLLAACTLTEEPVILHNVPNIRDVQTMRSLLESLGVEIKVSERALAPGTGSQPVPLRAGPGIVPQDPCLDPDCRTHGRPFWRALPASPRWGCHRTAQGGHPPASHPGPRRTDRIPARRKNIPFSSQPAERCQYFAG